MQISSLFLLECWGLALGKENQPSVNVTGSGVKWLGEGEADSEKIHLFWLCFSCVTDCCSACSLCFIWDLLGHWNRFICLG